MKKIVSISFILIIIDQLIKLIINQNMNLNSTISIINNFFNITYVRNTGAAFSILSGNILFLIIVSIIAIYLIYKYLIKDKKLDIIQIITYSLIISGAIGNMIDRIFRGYVIDYLDFKIFNFPIFNFADICIVIGCIVLIIMTVKEDKNGNKSN